MFTGRLIEHEEQETGSVSASTYIGFLRYAGGEHNLECISDNMALYFACRINKNALLQIVFFRRFCPLGSESGK